MTSIVAISEPGRGRPAKRRPFLRLVFRRVVDRGMGRKRAASVLPDDRDPAAHYINIRKARGARGPVHRLAD